jgi:hypothetical protein
VTLPAGRHFDNAFALSGMATVSIIALTLPASRRRGAAGPVQTIVAATVPTCLGAWLDLVLILCGVGFVARLLFFVSGDLGHTLSLLANDPRRLIQLILDSANQSGGLSDPLNLAGPALLLTGIALFWLRLFPRLIRLVGGIFTRRDNLTGPLAVWNVERDPGHYAQLVLLLIGTLALGTAALALGSTRDVGAWSAARLATGGAARIDLDRLVHPDTIDWLDLPGVSGLARLTRAETEYQVGQNQIFLVGVNPGEMAATFPERQTCGSWSASQSISRIRSCPS